LGRGAETVRFSILGPEMDRHSAFMKNSNLLLKYFILMVQARALGPWSRPSPWSRPGLPGPWSRPGPTGPQIIND
jgi:hypothetical protein